MRGATLLGGVQTSYCGVSSCCVARAPGTPASVVAACRLSSCSSQALSRVQAQYLWWACGIFPNQGLNPCILALADGLSTTAPPGKSLHLHFYEQGLVRANSLPQQIQAGCHARQRAPDPSPCPSALGWKHWAASWKPWKASRSAPLWGRAGREESTV